jgi:hypothetical protein
VTDHGGLNDAVRRARELPDLSESKKRQPTALTKAVTRLTLIQGPPT